MYAQVCQKQWRPDPKFLKHLHKPAGGTNTPGPARVNIFLSAYSLSYEESLS